MHWSLHLPLPVPGASASDALKIAYEKNHAFDAVRALAELNSLTAEQRGAVLTLAGENPTRQLEIIGRLRPTWGYPDAVVSEDPIARQVMSAVRAVHAALLDHPDTPVLVAVSGTTHEVDEHVAGRVAIHIDFLHTVHADEPAQLTHSESPVADALREDREGEVTTFAPVL